MQSATGGQAGFVCVMFSDERRYGYIIDMYCIPEKRRNGYSSKIMEELLKWLQSKGIHTIKLKPSEAGKHLYEKFGFCDSGEMELWI